MDAEDQEVVVERPADQGEQIVAEGPTGPGPEEPGSGDRVLEELEQTKAAYLRLAADFENYKRRRTQEVQDLTRYGSAGLLRAILPAIDNLARAVSHIPEQAGDGVAEGLRLTVRQLEEALLSEGVERVPSVGAPFDPRLHEAVATVPGGEAPEGTVVAEYLPGYRVHDRVVRAAQVAVAGRSNGAPGRGDQATLQDGGGAAADSAGNGS
ncbi:MAG: nucleotide exchange factor GrpE [Candidatus Dormiibacterota bacterium]